MNTENRRKELLELQNWRCCWCGKALTLEFATLEHIIPKVMGGSLSFDNTAAAHGTCNTARGSNYLQQPHDGIAGDRVRRRLSAYHAGIAKQDICKLGLPIPAVRWLQAPTSGSNDG